MLPQGGMAYPTLKGTGLLGCEFGEAGVIEGCLRGCRGRKKATQPSGQQRKAFFSVVGRNRFLNKIIHIKTVCMV